MLNKNKWSVQFFLILVVFCLFLFFSCKKNEENTTGPFIQFKTGGQYISSDTSILIGKNFTVGITASKGDANITNFVIKLDNGTTQTYLDSGLNSATFSLDKILTKGVSQNEAWTFIVRDKNGKTASLSFIITADSSSVYGPVVTYSSVVLGAQNNISTGSFFDIKNNIVYTLSHAYSVQDSVELCYYYDFLQGENNVIASPGANIDASVYTGQYALANWTVKNETRYLITTLTGTDFNNITTDSLLIAEYNQPLAKRKAKNLVAGDIYSFKTAKGKFGLFKVLNVNGTDAGTVEVMIKMQEY